MSNEPQIPAGAPKLPTESDQFNDFSKQIEEQYKSAQLEEQHKREQQQALEAHDRLKKLEAAGFVSKYELQQMQQALEAQYKQLKAEWDALRAFAIKKKAQGDAIFPQQEEPAPTEDEMKLREAWGQLAQFTQPVKK